MKKLEDETFPNSVTIIRAIVNMTVCTIGIITVIALGVKIFIIKQNYELFIVIVFAIVLFVILFLSELKTFRLIMKKF